jgi:ATP-dependent DNA helicase RecQ
MQSGINGGSPVNWSLMLDEARRRFGITRFWPGQRALIEAVWQGRDALGILPTGGGKSLAFQLPALFLEKSTVVVSPLISLMQDQEDKLREAGVGVVRLNSTLSPAEEEAAAQTIRRGNARLILVTPERLEKAEWVRVLKDAGISLLVVDEAHCISQWGHDFRPAYLVLKKAFQELGRPPILGLTATATADVVDDVVEQLGMKEVVVINTGIDRPNLLYEVRRTVNTQAKREQIRQILEQEGIGLIYTATVRQACETWDWLLAQDCKAGLYHGQLSSKERQDVQDRFMRDEFKAVAGMNYRKRRLSSRTSRWRHRIPVLPRCLSRKGKR